MSICVGTTVPACPLVGTRAFIPSATRLSAAPHSGDQGQEDGVSQFPSCSQGPPCVPPSQWPLTSPSSPSWVCEWVWGVWAAAGRGSERLHYAANSWRTAVQPWLSKREELRKTGTKARQLHPLGCLGLPTTSPCFSKPYVHPLPRPTPHPVSK